MWQEIIVGICVLGAVVFLLRRWVIPGKKSAACGGCGGCDNKPAGTGCATSSSDKSAP